ncbi:hypothetical protein R0K17_09465 [Planococcus sp. SIMBA_143]
MIPRWLVESVVVGIFTLVGAGTGAFLAGQFTLKSVEKQIEHSESEVERIRKANSDNALRIIDYSLEDIFPSLVEVTSIFSLEDVYFTAFQSSIRELKEPIEKVESILNNPELLAKISERYITDIPSRIRMHIGHLKKVIRSVENHKGRFAGDYNKGITDALGIIYNDLEDISKDIKLIVNDTSANR